MRAHFRNCERLEVKGLLARIQMSTTLRTRFSLPNRSNALFCDCNVVLRSIPLYDTFRAFVYQFVYQPASKKTASGEISGASPPMATAH